jgi:hypothetical protein
VQIAAPCAVAVVDEDFVVEHVQAVEGRDLFKVWVVVRPINWEMQC